MRELRTAEKADLPAIAALEKECFPLGVPEDALERMLSDPMTVMLCVTEGETLLGWGYFQTVLDEGYVGDLAVAAEERRRGVGTMLVRGMTASARERGLAFLTLEVRQSNLPARKTYEKCGFREAGRRRNYYEKPREDAVLMTVTFRGEDEEC